MEKQEFERESKKGRLITYAFISILVFIFSLFALFFYWANANYDVLDIETIPIPVIRQEVDAGEAILLLYDYCKNIDVEGEVEVSLVSGELGANILLPPSTDTSHPGCAHDFAIPMIVPAQAMTGKYHFHYLVTYKVNPVREVVEEWDTQEFNVTGVEEVE